jgi:hypothetical protein
MLINRRLLWTAALLTVAIFLFNFYLVGFGVFGDGLGYYLPLRSFLFDGNLHIGDEYLALADSASRSGQGLRVTGNETDYSIYTLGMAIVLAPWYVLGHGLAWGLNPLGWAIALDGLSWPYELMYCLGSVSLGIAGLLLCHRLAQRWFSPFGATWAVLGVWFASPLTFYMTLEASMSHAVSQFLVSLFLYLCLVMPWGRRPAQPWILGLVLGLAVLVRPQNLLFGVVPLGLAWQRLSQGGTIAPASMGGGATVGGARVGGAEVDVSTLQGTGGEAQANPPGHGRCSQLPQLLQESLLPLALLGLTVGLLLLLQAGIYFAQHGSVIDIPYLQSGQAAGQGKSFNWGQPKLLQVLFSGFHGLISWHPLLGVALLGLLLGRGPSPRRTTGLRWLLLLAFGVQLYVVSAWWAWWQGASFGGRMFSSCSLIFVLGLAALWDGLGNWLPRRAGRALAIALTLLAMLWNALLVMQYESAMIPAEEAVPLLELYGNQFSALPYFVQHVLNR